MGLGRWAGGQEWRDEPRLLMPRGAMAGAVAGGRMVVLGGCTARAQLLPTVEVFDPAARRWRPGAGGGLLPVRRYGAVAVAVPPPGGGGGEEGGGVGGDDSDSDGEGSRKDGGDEEEGTWFVDSDGRRAEPAQSEGSGGLGAGGWSLGASESSSESS